MDYHFPGKTQLAGNVRTGIRSLIAEQVAAQGGLVFGLGRDHQALADELQHMSKIARVIDVSGVLSKLAGILSAEQLDKAEVGNGWIDIAYPSALARVRKLFGGWFETTEWNKPRVIFMARESGVEAPTELIDGALAVFANLATASIGEPAPVKTAATGDEHQVRIVDPGRKMIAQQEARFLAGYPFQPSFGRLARLAAFLIPPT